MMKKSIILFMMVIMTGFAALALTAEELCGCRWQSKMETLPMGDDGDSGMSIQTGYDLTLNVDGAANVVGKMNILMNDGSGMAIDVYMKIVAEGKYLLLGNTLSISLDASTVKAQLSEDDIRVRGVQDRDMEKQIISNMMMNMQQMQTSMAQEIASEPLVLSDIVVDGKKMTCVEKDKESGTQMHYTFAKKKL